MSFCPSCGAEIDGSIAFCPSCGAKLSPAQTPPAYEYGTQQTNAQHPYAQQAFAQDPQPVHSVSFNEAVTRFFKKYADFSGRATRAEFWYAYLAVFVFNMLFSIIVRASQSTLMSALSIIVSLVLLIPMLAVSWRRLHDIGKSGGYYFIFLVPIVGPILLLIAWCKESDGDNQYGPRITDATYEEL